MRSESTSAFGQPKLTKPILGVLRLFKLIQGLGDTLFARRRILLQKRRFSPRTSENYC